MLLWYDKTGMMGWEGYVLKNWRHYVEYGSLMPLIGEFYANHHLYALAVLLIWLWLNNYA